MTLQGKTALVTGASRGIGAAIAKALAADGAKVAVGYRNDKDSALEVASEIEGKAILIDVSDSEGVAAAFDEVEQTMGTVDILVNNAGITRDRLLLRMREADWEDVLQTDLTGVFRCTKRALPNMLTSDWGRIVTIGSVVGEIGNPGQTNYAAAKAGVVGFTKALSREVASHGITVNVVAPGFVETALTSGLSEGAKEQLINRTSMKREGEPHEVAQAVRFCVTASYLTGQVINIDGGI
jgi:3-oxoacyl-[acyl-carrier protein] reductase